MAKLPNELGVSEAAIAIRCGKFTCVELMEACLVRIKAREPIVGAWAHLDRDGALNEARRCDMQQPTSLLHGIPLAVKDIVDTVDMPTACGSSIYARRRPSWDAACVALVKRAGAIVLGKSVTTEFAYFAPGKTANPWNPLHTPGGSSSGSAAAVADMMVPAAFGTQTAASITRPASFCGVVGYKPSTGQFSLAGIKPLAESLDTLGVLTRCVEDSSLMRAALLGEATPPRPHRQGPHPRIALCRTPWWDLAETSTQAAIESAADILSRGGAQIEELRLPASFCTLPDFQKRIMAYDAAHSLAYEYDTHRSDLSRPLTQLIEEGIQVSRDDYIEAQAGASAGRLEYAKLLERWDALLAPSAKGEAPLGLSSTGDPLFSRMWTLLHVPSITLPGFIGAAGLPVGVQLVGAFNSDDKLLSLAAWVEDKIRCAQTVNGGPP